MSENHRPEVDLAGMIADIEGVTDARAPLVLLHGLTWDHRMWGPTLEHLRRIDPGRRVIALDLPGHGRSAPRTSHTLERTVHAVHQAVQAAEVDAPVLVGHSISGAIATLYASAHPVRGVINVDSPPKVDGFATALQGIAEALRGPGFAAVWESISSGFGIDLLPPDGQELIRSTARPDQDLQLGYWQDIFETSPGDLQAWMDKTVAEVRTRAVPYTLVVGSPLDPDVQQWMNDAMPDAVIETWSDGGHFPHVAFPDRFARLLAARV